MHVSSSKTIVHTVLLCQYMIHLYMKLYKMIISSVKIVSFTIKKQDPRVRYLSIGSVVGLGHTLQAVH